MQKTAGDTKEGIPTEASLALNPDVRRGDFEAKVGTLSWQDPYEMRTIEHRANRQNKKL